MIKDVMFYAKFFYTFSEKKKQMKMTVKISYAY